MANLPRNRERPTAKLARTLRQRAILAILLRKHALILSFVASLAHISEGENEDGPESFLGHLQKFGP
jgi:hypothetical protein